MHVEFMIQNPPSFVYEEQLILSYEKYVNWGFNHAEIIW